MKKLMIAAAIVCAAAISQAASVNWGGAIATPDGSGPLATGQQAYLLFSETAFTGAATLVNLSNETIDELGAMKANNGGSVVSTYSLTATDVDFDNAVFGAVWDRGSSADVNGYYAILIANEAGTFTSYMDMGQVTGTTSQSAPTSVDFNSSWSTNEQLTQGGYTVEVAAAVPEPTTGFLMLLGMAGLALRRRRA